jgi:hypothetical protein
MTGQIRIVLAVAAVLLAGGLAIAELTGGSSRTGGLAKASLHAASAQSAPHRPAVALASRSATTRASATTAAKASTSRTATSTRALSTQRTSSATHATSAARPSSVAAATSAATRTATSQSPPAPSAPVMSASAEGVLHLVHANGSTLYEEGQAHGALSGNVRAQLQVGATFSGSFIFFTRGGEIEGHGSAQPHSAGGPIESFAGADQITGGTGRYANAHGNGRLSGTFNRRTYAVVLQTSGTMCE